jgi:hypothetical protein
MEISMLLEEVKINKQNTMANYFNTLLRLQLEQLGVCNSWINLNLQMELLP